MSMFTMPARKYSTMDELRGYDQGQLDRMLRGAMRRHAITAAEWNALFTKGDRRYEASVQLAYRTQRYKSLRLKPIETATKKLSASLSSGGSITSSMLRVVKPIAESVAMNVVDKHMRRINKRITMVSKSCSVAIRLRLRRLKTTILQDVQKAMKKMCRRPRSSGRLCSDALWDVFYRSLEL